MANYRSERIDAWRGGAVILMIVYHFAYDLNYFRIVTWDFYHHPFWLGLRILIISLFIGIAGISLYLATRQGIRWRAYFKRLLILIGCALLITVASIFLFKQRFIFFGILHFMALASILGLGFRNGYWLNLLSGLILILVGMIYSHPWFDQGYLQWFGLMTHKPPTEDYVPLLPWFGVILLGIFIGKYLHQLDYLDSPMKSYWGPGLAIIGRHSLLIYLLHQPILWGLISAVGFL